MIMSNRRQLDQVIYMYLNTITEMVYIGSSMYGLPHRHKRHIKDAFQKEKKSHFHKALSSWSDECWERLILERCHSEEELDSAETRWIAECHALDENVGYNTYDARYLRSAIAGGEAMKRRSFSAEECVVKSENGKLDGKLGTARARELPGVTYVNDIRKKKFAAMTLDEQREFFRECGKREHHMDPRVPGPRLR